MPGVPSGKGCDGCRKQRKKCDQGKPACSRCRRLKIVCTGAGQQRFQFKEHLGYRNSSPKEQHPNTTQPSYSTLRVVHCSPCNIQTRLASSFLDTIKPTTDIRFNLVWTYGFFLEEIPRRLGRNEALDSSIDALVAAHSSLCTRQKASVSTLMKYSRALRTLRLYLNDPVKALASETLCSVMILMMCQSFIGLEGNAGGWMGHFEGAAQILKARQYYDTEDEFECKILLTIRGPVLFGAIFHPGIYFTQEEWQTLVVNKFDGNTFEGRMMLSLTHLPDYMERGRIQWKTGVEDPSLLDDTRGNYQDYKRLLDEIKPKVHTGDMNMITQDLKPTIGSEAYYQRIYAIALTIGIMYNIMLRAIDPESKTLASEAAIFAEEIMPLNTFARQCRPLGGSYMLLASMFAWMGTTDEELRLSAKESLILFMTDFPTDSDAAPTAGLESTFRLLQLENILDLT